jgi:hypothetical protein
MSALEQVATLDCTRPCPVCDQHLDLCKVETVSWAPRTSGERRVFRCARCGVTQSEWKTIPCVVSGPGISPERDRGLSSRRFHRPRIARFGPEGARRDWVHEIKRDGRSPKGKIFLRCRQFP